MSDELLYSQLFSQADLQKNEKKDNNPDILNSLYQLDLPAPKKKEPEIRKRKHEDEINQYISGTNKNKINPPPPKSKEHQTYKVESASRKPTLALHPVKSSTPKPAERVQNNKESRYMPTVVDIFAKKGDNSVKNPAVQKSSISQVRPQEKKSKVQVKKDKIERKQLQIHNKTKEINPAARLQSQDRSKEQPMKYKQVHKDGPQKKRKQTSSESSSSSSSSSSPASQSNIQYWMKQLRKQTRYNPRDIKFRERDQMVIKQSGVDRIFGEDKFSYRMGRKQQEEDMRLEQMRRQKKLKKQHRDRR